MIKNLLRKDSSIFLQRVFDFRHLHKRKLKPEFTVQATLVGGVVMTRLVLVLKEVQIL